MRSNNDGVFLDGDGRPLRGAGRVPVVAAAPHPSSEALPPVDVEKVEPGDMILRGGQWVRVDELWVDGPRVSVTIDGKKVPYELGQKVTVLPALAQQKANPAFLDNIGPSVFTSHLVQRVGDRFGRRRRVEPGRPEVTR